MHRGSLKPAVHSAHELTYASKILVCAETPISIQLIFIPDIYSLFIFYNFIFRWKPCKAKMPEMRNMATTLEKIMSSHNILQNFVEVLQTELERKDT